MVKNKNKYNPFKMAGSYIGLGVALLYSFFGALPNILGKIGFNQILVIPFPSENTFAFINNFTFVIGLTMHLVFGFLLGWGIHSLMRALKK